MGIFDFLSRRAPSVAAATTPDGIVTLGIDDTVMPGHITSGMHKGSTPPERGSAEILGLFRTSPWLRAVTHKIASSFASVEWTVYASTSAVAGGGSKYVHNDTIKRSTPLVRPALVRRAVSTGELEALHKHPLSVLLKKPNPVMSGRTMRHVCQVHVDLLGETFIVLDTNPAGMPIRMWPIPPTWVKDLPTDQAPFYKVDIDNTSHQIPITNMIHIRDPNPANPYGRGVGVGMSLADEVDVDEFAAKHVSTWFHNKGMPDMLISMEGAHKPALEQAKRTWDNANRGFQKAYRTHWTGAKLDVKRLDTSFKDMALLEIRTFERNSIIQVFGVPPEKIGIIDNSNRSTSESAHFIFANDVIVPRCELWRSELQNKLVERFDERLILEYTSPVPGDREYRRSIMQAFSNVFTVDEIRSLADMDPLPNKQGEGYIMPPGQIYVTDLTSLQAPPVFGYHLSAGVLTNNEIREKLKLPPALGDWGNERSTGMYVDPNMFLGTGASDGATALPADVQAGNTSAMQQARLALSAVRPVRKSISKAKIKAILDSVDEEAMWGRAEPVLRSLMTTWGNDTMKAIGYASDFDMNAPDVATFLREYAADRLGRLVGQTTKDELAIALQEVEASGGDDEEGAAAVRRVFTRAEVERSDMIAETEVRRSSMFASKEAMTQSGIVLQNEWLSTQDGRARDSHLTMDGQQRDLDKPFELVSGQHAGARTMYPGGFGIAGEDINCRCAIAPTMIEDDVEAAAIINARKSGLVLTSRMTEDERITVWRALDAKAIAWEARYARAISAGFRSQEQAALAALK